MINQPHEKPGRRHFLKSASGLLGMLLLEPACAPRGPAKADLPAPPGLIPPSLDPGADLLTRLTARFIGEDLRYRMTLFKVFNAAEASINMEPGPEQNQVTSRLTARSTGFFSWLYNDREESFVSVMEAGKNPYTGSDMLITSSFERHSVVNDVEVSSRHTFKYGSERIWSYKIYENGKLKSGRQATIPPGMIYENFLSFFYNFRSGAYGGVERGREFEVNTIPYKGVDVFGIRIATDEEMAAEGEWVRKTPAVDFMMVVTINRKIFGINAGKARILASREMIPLVGAIKNAVSFGDLTAELINSPY